MWSGPPIDIGRKNSAPGFCHSGSVSLFVLPTFKRLALSLGLLAGLGLVAPDLAFAERPSTSASCKRAKKNKKKKRSKRKARRARRASKKKIRRVTAKQIKRMQRRGLTDDQIVAKAHAAKYKLTKRERRQLKRLRVRKTLIAALDRPVASTVAAAAPAEPLKFDLDKTIDPNDIDFDSVPPPEGMPTEFAKKPEPKKGLNTSLRPSAPFVAKSPAAAGEKKERRVIVSATN